MSRIKPAEFWNDRAYGRRLSYRPRSEAAELYWCTKLPWNRPASTSAASRSGEERGPITGHGRGTGFRKLCCSSRNLPTTGHGFWRRCVKRKGVCCSELFAASDAAPDPPELDVYEYAHH